MANNVISENGVEYLVFLCYHPNCFKNTDKMIGEYFMIRILSTLSLLLTMFVLTACGASSSKSYELALITDVGTIDDKSFNQSAWEGMKAYAEEHDITYKYYQPTEKATSAFETAFDLAVEGGAKVIVCSGYLFEVAVYNAQTKYPDVKFILLDGQPHDENEDPTKVDYTIKDNVNAIFYAEEQSGFLAGYAAVKDGYKNLGFIGGMEAPAVIRYGYGFVQGAEYAANEMGLDDVTVKYNYSGTFSASPEVQSMAASWYNQGTEVIFACGGQIGNSIMTAAEATGGKVIGVDVDQSSESTSVITSATKQLSVSVKNAIDSYYNGSFAGGQVVTLDATSQAVGLPLKTSLFKQFNEADYNAIYEKIVSGEITIKKNTDAKKVTDLSIERLSITNIG